MSTVPWHGGSLAAGKDLHPLSLIRGFLRLFIINKQYMRTEGQTVFVPWYGKMLEGNIVRENGLMGLTAVRIPLQGQHPVALFSPGHVYDTAEAAGIPESVPKMEESVPKMEETSECEAFRKAHWDHERNHLRIDALDGFYSLWKKEHAPSGYVEEAVTKSETKPIKKNVKAIQLSLFD